MNRLQNLQPWQIILGAVATLLVFATISYFAVTALTTTKPQAAAPPPPKDLESDQNKKTLEALGYFTVPQSLPLPLDPLQTPDPDRPSNINPFQP